MTSSGRARSGASVSTSTATTGTSVMGEPVSEDGKEAAYPGLLRLAISRDARKMAIRSEHLTSILHRYGLKGHTKLWASALDQRIKDIFGLRLNQCGPQFILESALEKRSSEVLMKMLSEIPPNELNVVATLSSKTGSGTLSSHESLRGGVAILVIALVTICDNRMNEIDLIDYMARVGLADARGKSGLGNITDTNDILNELVKQKFLAKNTSVDPTGTRNHVYSLGINSAQIGADTIFSYLKQGNSDELYAKKCLSNISKCFPGFETPPPFS